MRLLVIGGAGYIGSVTAEVLLARGHSVTILDDFSTGHEEAVPRGARLLSGSLADAGLMSKAFKQGCDAVLHFAARSIVPESVRLPGLYFSNNVGGAIALLQSMASHGVRRLVFSSTAAVYGIPDHVPIREDAPLRPNNPYGSTKAMIEELLRWHLQTGLVYAVLRYFNAAGASEHRGEDHSPETHLIPLALEAAAGLRPGMDIYGTDYPTRDGTGIRDYIHVLDLAEAHALAVERLDAEPILCNLGTESGYSVREVLDSIRRVTGRDFPVTEKPRREGDAPATIADAGLARELLGWEARRGLDEMVESAWRWRQGHPAGYSG